VAKPLAPAAPSTDAQPRPATGPAGQPPPKKEGQYVEYTEERGRPSRRRREADGLTPRDRDALREAFRRAMWGAKLIWGSFLLYTVSMILIGVYAISTAVTGSETALRVVPGAAGLLNWIVGGIGLGFCIFGRTSPGHWGYAIAAAIVTVIHALLLAAIVVQPAEYALPRPWVDRGSPDGWDQLPTQIDRVPLYLAFLVYPDEFKENYRPGVTLAVLTGVVEVVRIVLLLVVLSCLARAAGDEELALRCTRVAGRTVFVPGILALGLLILFVFVFETGAKQSGLGVFILAFTYRAMYLAVGFTFVPSMLAARDVAEACEFPFQSGSGTGEPEYYLPPRSLW
jgi:hypothetical protein